MAAGFGVTAVLVALLVGTASLDDNPVQSMAAPAPDSGSFSAESAEKEEPGQVSASATERPEVPVGATETVVVTVRPAPVVVREPAARTAPKKAPSATTSAQRLSQAAGAVQQYGRSRPTVFTGIDIDTRGNRLVVWRKPDAAFDAKVRAIAENTTVELRDAPRSLSQLQTLQRNVINYSAANDIAVVSLAMPHDGSALLVRISSNLSTGRSALTKEFGTAVRVEAGVWAEGL